MMGEPDIFLRLTLSDPVLRFLLGFLLALLTFAGSTSASATLRSY